MSNLQRSPVETLHHIAAITEQMAQQARRSDEPFLAYLLSMASQQAKAELKDIGYPMPTEPAAPIVGIR